MVSVETEQVSSVSFENFSNNARGVLIKARMEASAYDSIDIEPNHILLGILSNKRCSAAKKLADLGVDFEKVIQKVSEVEKLKNRPTLNLSLSGLVHLEEVKELVEKSFKSAKMDSTSFIDTYHLLLGLCRWAKDDPNFVLSKFLDFNLN